MAVHRPAHHHTVAADFIDNDVLLERTEHDKGTPVPQARMNEAATRPKLRVLAEELTGLPLRRGNVPPPPNLRRLSTTRIAAPRPQGKRPSCGRSRRSGL